MTEWQIYCRDYDPFGNERLDLHAGIVASTIANVNRGKNTHPFKPTDFMPLHKKPPQTVEEQKQMAKAIAGMFAGLSQKKVKQ